MSRPSLTVLMAVYREGARLQAAATSLRRFLEQRGGRWELIVLSDGGTPETEGALDALEGADSRVRLVRLERNRGQGAALKVGALMGQGDLIAYVDADLSAAPEQLARLETAIVEEGYDVAIASRWMRGADVRRRQPWARRVLGRAYYRLVRVLFGLSYADTNCGMKMYRRHAAHLLFGFLRCWRWSFNAESLVLAGRFGLRVKEVPIVWEHESRSSVRVLRDVCFTLWETGMTRARLAFGLYPQLRVGDAPGLVGGAPVAASAPYADELA